MAKDAMVRLGLLVKTEHERGYFHVNASVVIIGRTPREMQAIDNGDKDVPHVDYQRVTTPDSYGTVKGLWLDGLRVTSQGTDEDRTTDRGRHLYAQQLMFKDVDIIMDDNTKNIEERVKTLRTIAKRMEKLDAKVGRYRTFGQFLGRIALAIGIEQFVFIPEKNLRSGAEYTFYSNPSGMDMVDYLVNRWVEEGNELTNAGR